MARVQLFAVLIVALVATAPAHADPLDDFVPAINNIFGFLNVLDGADSKLLSSSLKSDIDTAQGLVSAFEGLLGAPVAAPFTGCKLMGST